MEPLRQNSGLLSVDEQDNNTLISHQLQEVNDALSEVQEFAYYE
jgi:hypothetical protein